MSRSIVVSSFILSCFALLVLIPSAEAASYKKKDGTIVDPIMKTAASGGGHLPYSGTNLEPWASVPGVVLNNAWLDHADLNHADLIGAHMNWTWLQDASLQSANLQHAALNIAVLHRVDFSGANLTHAGMMSSDLSNAIFHGATGHPATLSSSQLTLTDIEEMIVGADITGADFSDANLTGADFNHENDLLDVIGWASAT